jgi:drug/metabolite transporter (DMT)-like permease
MKKPQSYDVTPESLDTVARALVAQDHPDPGMILAASAMLTLFRYDLLTRRVVAPVRVGEWTLAGACALGGIGSAFQAIATFHYGCGGHPSIVASYSLFGCVALLGLSFACAFEAGRRMRWARRALEEGRRRG